MVLAAIMAALILELVTTCNTLHVMMVHAFSEMILVDMYSMMLMAI
jgi:hypothetical protein